MHSKYTIQTSTKISNHQHLHISRKKFVKSIPVFRSPMMIPIHFSALLSTLSLAPRPKTIHHDLPNQRSFGTPEFSLIIASLAFRRTEVSRGSELAISQSNEPLLSKRPLFSGRGLSSQLDSSSWGTVNDALCNRSAGCRFARGRRRHRDQPGDKLAILRRDNAGQVIDASAMCASETTERCLPGP